MVREHLERFHAFLLTVFLKFLAQHHLLSRFVLALIKVEFATLLWAFNAPPGQNLCQFGDVVLRVSAIYSECVELHHLTRIVFVQATGTLALYGLTLCSRTLPSLLVDHPPEETASHTDTSGVGAAAIFREVRIRTDTLPIV